MSLILQNVIAFLPYVYRTRMLFRRGAYGCTWSEGTELKHRRDGIVLVCC